MSKAPLYAVVAVVFALLAVLLPDRLLPPDDNYRITSSVEEVFRGVVLGSFRFVLGAFAGLGLAAGLSSLLGSGAARRPWALVVSALLALAFVAVSGVFFRGLAVFPADRPIDERHRWAGAKLGRPYRAAVAWGTESAAVREACGETLRLGPAAGSRNAVRIDSKQWSFTLTLDVEGDRGRGRLWLSGVLALEPEGARPAVSSAVLEAGGARTILDPAGNAFGR